MNDMSTAYADLSGSNNNGDELMVQVYREFGFYWSFARSDRFPGFIDRRPEHCPDAIDIFLWGGLSTTITEVFMPFVVKRSWIHFFFVIITLALIFIPLFMQSSPLNFDGTIFYVLLLVFFSRLVCYWIMRPIVAEMNKDMEKAIEDLSPHFRKVGYDISYKTIAARGVAFDAHVRITRFSLATMMKVDEEAHTDTEQGVTQHRREFRVVVYGPVAEPSVPTCMKQHSDYMFTTGRTPELKLCIDKFTWGAVGTELRPLTLNYLSNVYKQRRLVFLFFLIWIYSVSSRVDDDDWGLGRFLLMALLLNIAPFFILWCVVQPYLVEKEHSPQLRQELQEKVQNLSPLVMEQSGYSLSMLTEIRRCGELVSFVYFHPSSTASMTATHQPLLIDRQIV